MLDPNPINVYGRTKLEAERLVLQNPAHTVVRIVLTAGTSEHRNRSFVEDMCRTAKAGKDMTLYADEFRCPLPAGALPEHCGNWSNRTSQACIISAAASVSRAGKSENYLCPMVS